MNNIRNPAVGVDLIDEYGNITSFTYEEWKMYKGLIIDDNQGRLTDLQNELKNK